MSLAKAIKPVGREALSSDVAVEGLVADSFIIGLHSWYFLQPVCLAQGDASPRESPLYDKEFLPEANPFPRRNLYLEYVHEFASNRPPLTVSRDFKAIIESLERQVRPLAAGAPIVGIHPPQTPPTRFLGPQPPTGRSRPYGPDCYGNPSDGEDRQNCVFDDLDDPLRIDTKATAGPLPEARYVSAARAFVQAWGWCWLPEQTAPPDRETLTCGEPRAFSLLIDAVPVFGPGGTANSRPVARYQKEVIVRFKRSVSDGSLEELDGDGTILVRLNNQAGVIGATRRWLPWNAPPPGGRRPDDQAYNDALCKLPGAAYRNAPYFKMTGLVRRGGVKAQLVPVDWFEFMPVAGSNLTPVTVEVPIDIGLEPRLLDR